MNQDKEIKNQNYLEKLCDEASKLFEDKKYAEAAQILEIAAKQGSTYAQYILSYLYKEGLGVKKDSTKAVKLIEEAAKNGDADAQFVFGKFYMEGIDIKQDYEKAIYWYKKAGEQGDIDAQKTLWVLYSSEVGVVEKDYKEAAYWLTKLAEQGDRDAQFNLAYYYDNGWGVEQSYIESVFWLKKAAEQGNIDAFYFLGLYYEKGLGVEQSYTEAVNWYKKAAKQGDIDAQEHLGGLYENGLGVEQDYEKAIYWYKKTGKQNYCENIISNLNGRKVKVIDNIAECLDEDIDEEKYGAIKVWPKENIDMEMHTLYSIEDFKKIRKNIKFLLEDVEPNNGENELKVFMQIYIMLAKIISYDEEAANNKDNFELKYTSRNLVGGILKEKCLCSGYAEILRNFLACRNIKCKIIHAKGHTYNQVKINNKWYYVDLTNDVDNIINGVNLEWCLKGKESFKDMEEEMHIDLPYQIIEKAEEDYPEDEIEEIYREMLMEQEESEKMNDEQTKKLLIELYKKAGLIPDGIKDLTTEEISPEESRKGNIK